MKQTKCQAIAIHAIAILAFGSAVRGEAMASVAPEVRVPKGFSIELAAGPPLVQRPIVAAFDEVGRLYVAESSGTNDPVEKQLQEKPHQILRLEDVDGDGKFDRRTIYADRMMFPEGTMFLNGSLYVAAPPIIWKLTDVDGDGVADKRVEWFNGKTLNKCANDLHGPYLGLDGWIYWCKGAFEEQTYVFDGHKWSSRAAHIFRCRPDGTGLEPFITGGMDNPVDVAFTASGERIVSSTYLEGDGRRDGLFHAVYGGVYGRDHGVLDGHRRTGELMPALSLMSPAAPCGLVRYESSAFGAGFEGNLFACQFNLRKVSRHVLRRKGATFATDDSDFVSSDNVDFHPTDVVMDADGSLLVVNTGGWYKLCCPTSQLWKPDVLGGIYRVRRIGSKQIDDARGIRLEWNVGLEHLWSLLVDVRPAVRERARLEFAARQGTTEMSRFLADLKEHSAGVWSLPGETWIGERQTTALPPQAAELSRTWALAQVDAAEARSLVRRLLTHPDEEVRHAALNAISLYRDAEAAPHLEQILASDTAANRRVAAEALGRLRDPTAVPHLLTAATTADDRFLRHAITYALIELAEPNTLRQALSSAESGAVASALMALDQIPGEHITAKHVLQILDSKDDVLRQTARWLLVRHSEWGHELAQRFHEKLKALPDDKGPQVTAKDGEDFESLLVNFTLHPSIQQLVADAVAEAGWPTEARRTCLRVMAHAKLTQLPEVWQAALVTVIADRAPELLAMAVDVAYEHRFSKPFNEHLYRILLTVSGTQEFPVEVRVKALAVCRGSSLELNDTQFQLLTNALLDENPLNVRSAAADAIADASLSPSQLRSLCYALESAKPLEVNRLLRPFEELNDEQLALTLLSSLKKAAALPSLRMDIVRAALSRCGPAVKQDLAELEQMVNVDAASQRERIADLLPLIVDGDVRRGHAVFYSPKVACSACHRLGHAGGNVGPELTRIGETRTAQDLLESILYPSLSFVRGYEPIVAYTVDGRAVSGIVRDENASELVIATAPDQETRVAREDIEDLQLSDVSVMPAGLDKQLSARELADLVAFLKSTGAR